METITLGRTGLQVSRTSFGALPIQRVSFADARTILRKAYDKGINFFDTARGYSDSEEKMGAALADVRQNLIIATKSHASTKDDLLDHVQTSLKNLKTDYIDILQLHNPAQVPNPEDPEGLFAGLEEARDRGWVRFFGITNHRLPVAREAIQSGLFDTLQFPLSVLSSDKDMQLAQECGERNVGFIAMKALSGGLVTNARAAFAFLRQYPHVVPIWGIQRERELDELLALEADPPSLDQSLQDSIDLDRQELSGSFCRGCGYCMPCPVGIPISMAARISLLLQRAPEQNFLTGEWQEKMRLINDCTQCGQCRAQCPYELDTPKLLQAELAKYEAVIAGIGR